MAYMVSTSANYHWIERMTAATNGGAALKLTLHGNSAVSDEQFNQAEITIFLEDAEMVDRLVEAINGVGSNVKVEEPPQPIDDGSCDPLFGERMDSADMGES